MSSLPEQDPFHPELSLPRREPSLTAEEDLSAVHGHLPSTIQEIPHAQENISAEPPLFHYWYPHGILPPARIPNLGHLMILALLAPFGLLAASLFTRIALQYHLFGISTPEKAIYDIHYTLINMTALYLVPFAASLLVFPHLWHKSFFAGLQWNAATALRLRQRLFGAAGACFVLALIDGLLLPGPADAPIDRLFQTPMEAWLLFAFGVTLAPFFEEILFRGFLLPALCTACDWTRELITGEPARPLGENGHPQWSIPAMIIASIFISIPFALMHAEQTAHALGPFVLLVCVSLVLCWARLTTRSLAASVLVHASYNFLLFSLMLFGTGGFRHLEKL